MIVAFIFSLTLLLGIGNHPELVWETIETEHFFIHFHKETERSAREAAIVAEKVYGPITSLYQFEPDSKPHIIIKDTDDIANGAAYFYDNKIFYADDEHPSELGAEMINNLIIERIKEINKK